MIAGVFLSFFIGIQFHSYYTDKVKKIETNKIVENIRNNCKISIHETRICEDGLWMHFSVINNSLHTIEVYDLSDDLPAYQIEYFIRDRWVLQPSMFLCLTNQKRIAISPQESHSFTCTIPVLFQNKKPFRIFTCALFNDSNLVAFEYIKIQSDTLTNELLIHH